MLTKGRHAVGQIYEEAERQGRLSLAPITEALGGSYGLFFAARTAGGVDEAFCHGVDPGYVGRLKEASHERLLPPWLGDLAQGSVFDRAAFGSDQAFGRTAFYNHVIRPEGRFHCMIATPCVMENRRFHLVIGRPRHKAEFDAADRRLLRAMLPHVGEVVRLQTEAARSRLSAQRARHLLDRMPLPMTLVSADAMLVFANQEARRRLAARDGLGIDARGRLASAVAHETAVLRQMVAGLAAGTIEGPRTLAVTRQAGAQPVVITATRVEPQDGEDAGAVADVMIVIEQTVRSTIVDHAAVVARTFGLTRRETELATLLAGGRDLRSAGLDLGMSYNTARSYLRQIFSKADVHRQSDLVRLLTTGERSLI